jgi:predicted dehydrogenase
VFAATQNWLRRENPDVAIGILEWEDRLRAVMQNIWHLSGGPYGDDMETKIFADATTYTVRNEPVVQIWEAQAKCVVPESFYWPFINGVRGGAIADELHHFIDCAKKQIDTPLVPLDQIQNGIDTAQALIRSAKSGRWENV